MTACRTEVAEHAVKWFFGIYYERLAVVSGFQGGR